MRVFAGLPPISARSCTCPPAATLLTAARHQSFIASHLLGGLLALCVFPVYLVVNGKPSLLGAAAFLWLLSPIGIAIFLSRTGKFAAAHFASAANFAGLVTYTAWLTGGLSSWLIPWMVAVPLEAALANERRIVAWAAGVAGLGLGHPRLHPIARLLHAGRDVAALADDAVAARRHDGDRLCRRSRGHGPARPQAERECRPLGRRALPAARRERDRHDHPPRREGPRRLRLACGTVSVRRAGAEDSGGRSVRARACRRPAGLSHRAVALPRQ